MELINGSYKALEKEFLTYFSSVKTKPLEKILIITQSERLTQNLKAKLLSSKECLSCVFWQDILGLVSSINQASAAYIPLKEPTSLDYFKLKDFLERHNFNTSPGYIQALESSFRDMQNALIMPQDLKKIEEFDPSLSSKELKDLIFIYHNYLNLSVQPGRVSYKDFFVSALGNIENNTYLAQFKQIIFYGIYDLTSLQYDILKAVSQNYKTTLFFPYETNPSYKYLQDFYLTNILGLAQKHKKLDLGKSELETFCSHLFEVSSQEQNKYKASLKLIDTSGTLDQVKSAAKEVLLLNKQGIAFKDIAICARSLEPYKNYLPEVFKQNSIPININFEEPLLNRPLVSVCLNLLSIVRNNFHKDSVLSFINSPYLKAERKNWGKLIKDIGVQTGFKQWQNLLDLAVQKGQEGALNLKDFLTKIEKEVSFLEQASSFSALSQKVKDIFNTFLAPETFNSEEQKLFKQLEDILAELATFDSVRFAKQGEFLDEFIYLLTKQKTNFVVNLQNALTIADIMNLRGNTFKVIIILGLNEGIFPARISEDPVFKDLWRLTLQKLGYNIKLSVQRYQEEKLLFYFALNSAEEKAILIHQRCDEEGKLKVPSVYLNWVFKLAENIEKFSLSRRPKEQLLQWYKIAPELLNEQEASLFAAFEGNYSLAASLVGQEDLELFLQAFSLTLEGPLGSRDMVFKRQGPLWQHLIQKGFSPSSFSTLYKCPASYLFDKLLSREDLNLLQRDKLDLRDKGILQHIILHDFYSYLKERNLFDKISPIGALEILQNFIKDNLKETDYKKYGLYPLIWFIICTEIELSLKDFVVKDLTRILTARQEPAYFEKDICTDVASLKIHGQIDRIDISKDNKTFSIIDYKSGEVKASKDKSSVIFKEAKAQGPFYFEMAKTLSDLKNSEPQEMIYASLKDSSFKEITYQDYLAFKEKFWSLAEFLKSLVEEGLFPITPSKTACQYCSFGDICRKNHAATQRRANFSKQAAKLREYRK